MTRKSVGRSTRPGLGRSPITRRASAIFCALALVAGGCDDKPKIDADQADAGPDGGPVLGGKIGEAVAAAGTVSDAGAKSEALQEGPPEGGIFPAGVADTKHKSGAEPTIELLDQGAEPRIVLPRPNFDASQAATLVLAIRTGQPGFPAFKLGLRIGPEAPAKDKDDKEPKEPAAPAPGGERKVSVVFESAEVAGAETMALPKQVIEAISSLKGSAIHFTVKGAGPVDTRFELADKAEEGLANVLRATMDVVSNVWVPVPDKPVGVGAYWMVTDRLPSFGVDVVRYRVFKVESIEGGKAQLTADLRQYATSDRIDLPETKSVSLAQYDQQGNAKLLFSGDTLPAAAEVLIRTQALLAPPGAKNAGAQAQVQPMQIEVQAQLVQGSGPPKPDDRGSKGSKPGAPAPPPAPPAPAP